MKKMTSKDIDIDTLLCHHIQKQNEVKLLEIHDLMEEQKIAMVELESMEKLISMFNRMVRDEKLNRILNG